MINENPLMKLNLKEITMKSLNYMKGNNWGNFFGKDTLLFVNTESAA